MAHVFRNAGLRRWREIWLTVSVCLVICEPLLVFVNICGGSFI